MNQTRLLYGGAARITTTRLAELDLPEGNAMRAPGEAPGMMALEVAMDEMAEQLGLDPVEFRIRNDTQMDPEKPGRPFSQRRLVECLRSGAALGWSRARPARAGARRDDGWSAWASPRLPKNIVTKAGARVPLDTATRSSSSRHDRHRHRLVHDHAQTAARRGRDDRQGSVDSALG